MRERTGRLITAALLASALALVACGDDEKGPTAPATGEDLKTPTSKNVPPEPPDQ